MECHRFKERRSQKNVLHYSSLDFSQLLYVEHIYSVLQLFFFSCASHWGGGGGVGGGGDFSEGTLCCLWNAINQSWPVSSFSFTHSSQTHSRTHAHACAHACAHTHTHACTNTVNGHTQLDLHATLQVLACPPTRAHIHTHTHTHTHTAHSRTYTCARAHICTRTCASTHSDMHITCRKQYMHKRTAGCVLNVGWSSLSCHARAEKARMV